MKEIESDSAELIRSNDFIAYNGTLLPDINELPSKDSSSPRVDDATDMVSSLVVLAKSSPPWRRLGRVSVSGMLSSEGLRLEK